MIVSNIYDAQSDTLGGSLTSSNIANDSLNVIETSSSNFPLLDICNENTIEILITSIITNVPIATNTLYLASLSTKGEFNI